MKYERITFLDGLKGFACLGVFTHHFFLSFFPASYFGADAPSMTASGFDTWLSTEPYAFFVNGNFWVCLFLLISAFLLSGKIFALRESPSDQSFDRLSRMILKRYLRLMIPATLIGILNYFLVILLNITNLNYMQEVNALSFPKLLYHAVIHMWIQVDSSVQGPFWMLHYLVFGSYLAILIALATPIKSRWTPCIHLFLAVVMGICSRYYAGIVLGVMICYEYRYGKFLPYLIRETSQHAKLLRFATGSILLLTGLFLGAYPSYVKPVNIYRIFNAYAFRDPDAYEMIHCIGAACLLLSFFLLKGLASLFSTKPFLFIGKISFSIYLIHGMLLKYLGYFTMHRLTEQIGNYSLAGSLTYLLLLIPLLLLSLICFHTIERIGTVICKKLSL